MKATVISYNIMTRTASGGEPAILKMLWRQNEGVSDKNFSRQDAPLNYLRPAITPCIPPLSSHNLTHCPLVLQSDSAYPGYRIVEEVYMKYKWGWGRHFD
jgi:hypothetical protein